MKIIVTTLFLIVMSYQTVNAAQTCKDFIPNEWSNTRYSNDSISNDNVVIDLKTGLMWKQCSQGLTGEDCTEGSVENYTWEEALDLAESENFAGYSNWRVPNQKELRSIVSRNCFDPSINETVFPNSPSNQYWSSSPIVYREICGAGCLPIQNEVWAVDFIDGIDDLVDRIESYNIRLVRTVTAPK